MTTHPVRQTALRNRLPARIDDRPAAALAAVLHLCDLARERQPEREEYFAVRAARLQLMFERRFDR